MTANSRWITRRTLVLALQADDALTGIQITRGWMGDSMERESIWLGHSATTTGSLEVPVFTGPDTNANPVTYNDRYTIPIHLVAGSSGQSLEEAEDRAEALYLPVERVIRTNPSLKGLTDPENPSGLVHALLNEFTLESFATKEGFASFVDVQLTCLSRISGGAT